MVTIYVSRWDWWLHSFQVWGISGRAKSLGAAHRLVGFEARAACGIAIMLIMLIVLVRPSSPKAPKPAPAAPVPPVAGNLRKGWDEFNWNHRDGLIWIDMDWHGDWQSNLGGAFELLNSPIFLSKFFNSAKDIARDQIIIHLANYSTVSWLHLTMTGCFA